MAIYYLIVSMVICKKVAFSGTQTHCELTLVAYYYIFLILQNIVTSSKCLVTRALRDRWIWYLTVLWWRHNILEYRKYTEICHQRATHSYIIVRFDRIFWDEGSKQNIWLIYFTKLDQMSRVGSRDRHTTLWGSYE